MRSRTWMIASVVAAAVLMSAGCQTTPVQDGAILGGALGAGLGAIAGSTMGRPGEGALIGAGAGALTGALVGDHIDRSTAPRAVVYRAAPPPPPVRRGRHEVRTVIGPTGERYEERVWVPAY